MEAQAVRDNYMSSHIVSKNTMEITPKHSIMTKLKTKATADTSVKTVKDLIRSRAMMVSGNDHDEVSGVDDDMTTCLLEEFEGAAYEASKMEDICQHGPHHEGRGSPRQFHVFSHCVQEDHGDQPKALHHDQVE